MNTVYSGSVQWEQLRPCGAWARNAEQRWQSDLPWHFPGPRVLSAIAAMAVGKGSPKTPIFPGPQLCSGGKLFPRCQRLQLHPGGQSCQQPHCARLGLAQPFCSRAGTEVGLGELWLQNPRLLCQWVAGGGPIAMFYPDLCSTSLVPGEHLRKEDSHHRWEMPVTTTLPHSNSLPHNQEDQHPSQASTKL